eukprot:CAMPEP_0206631302 /NCGR_PEP_ID=MMETSP0325_2-20121206/68120_1 /ASSEMBLY_ACC=CAM_ASM_000347 /TAXON_ID=2866 /ORGANISM="Crypthecodinium cohnii, Strain Seligo" /LENGTH=117 /DNA_ID=CAMNT_0054156391 /DNA_START=570 /DNA_END=923 /DNA_ORIENTATION=-
MTEPEMLLSCASESTKSSVLHTSQSTEQDPDFTVGERSMTVFRFGQLSSTGPPPMQSSGAHWAMQVVPSSIDWHCVGSRSSAAAGAPQGTTSEQPFRTISPVQSSSFTWHTSRGVPA